MASSDPSLKYYLANRMIPAVRIPSKSKIVHFVRHAQGEHNVVGEVNHEEYKREDLEDAHLSELGRQQCQQLFERSSQNRTVDDAELLVVSPMRRTLQTAQLSFPHLVGNIPWIALESVREQTGQHPCDRRRPVVEHQSDHSHVDFESIENETDPFYHLYPDCREPVTVVADRGRDFFKWLAARPERVIIVVTHSAYLRVLLTHVAAAHSDFHESHFDNCEMRTYALDLSGLV